MILKMYLLLQYDDTKIIRSMKTFLVGQMHQQIMKQYGNPIYIIEKNFILYFLFFNNRKYYDNLGSKFNGK